MATKKKGKARKKVAKKEEVKKPVVTQGRLDPIRVDLHQAAGMLTAGLKKAKELGLADREDSKRAYQQINNALVRCEAAIEELL